MKKVILVVLVAVAGVLSTNAQYYAGGSLNFGINTDKPKDGKKTTASSFGIAPEVGYSLSQDLDLGLAFNFNTSKNASDLKSSGWKIAPYARYSFVEFGRFSVLGKGEIFFGGATRETNEGVKIKNESTVFGLAITPVLKYSLSDHFDLLSNLNFLNIGFSQTSEKSDGHKFTNNGFNLGVNTGNVATLGDISIGFAYKF
jgi:hypothetical protein